MSRARKISELEEMVRWQADVEEATLRHTSTDLRRAINQSIQRFRELISDNGMPYFLKSYSGVLPTGRAKDDDGTSFAWGAFDLSSIEPAVVRVYGVDITVHNVVTELDPIEFTQRNHFQFGNQVNSIPLVWFLYDEHKMGFAPSPDTPYPLTVWYLPLAPDLMEDNDEFNPGVPGAEEWVIYDVMLKLLHRDNYPRLIQAIRVERDTLWKEILHRATRLNRQAAPKRIDTRGRTRNRRLYWLREWLLPSNSS